MKAVKKIRGLAGWASNRVKSAFGHHAVDMPDLNNMPQNEFGQKLAELISMRVTVQCGRDAFWNTDTYNGRHINDVQDEVGAGISRDVEELKRSKTCYSDVEALNHLIKAERPNMQIAQDSWLGIDREAA